MKVRPSAHPLVGAVSNRTYRDVKVITDSTITERGSYESQTFC